MKTVLYRTISVFFLVIIISLACFNFITSCFDLLNAKDDFINFCGMILILVIVLGYIAAISLLIIFLIKTNKQ
jgi:hypothetical protein